MLQSSGNYTTYFSTGWGAGADIPQPGDFDGDGRTDLAVFRPSTGVWFILQSGSGYSAYATYSWGANGDVPLVRQP